MSTPLYWVGDLCRAFFQIIFSTAVQRWRIYNFVTTLKLILFLEPPKSIIIQTNFHDFSKTVNLTDAAIDSFKNIWTLQWLSKVFRCSMLCFLKCQKIYILAFLNNFWPFSKKIWIHDRKMKSLMESISGVRVSSLVVATAKNWRRWSAWMRLWGSYYHFISTQLWTNSIKECD